jgi:hypothetical protein
MERNKEENKKREEIAFALSGLFSCINATKRNKTQRNATINQSVPASLD